jgi:hypothetical protein
MSWKDEVLTLTDARSGTRIEVRYLEAFCRDGSTDRAWEETVIPHRTELVSESAHQIQLRSTLADGVVADHRIDAGEEEVLFFVELHNPTAAASRVHWAQPCIGVADFVGVPFEHGAETYLPKCFVFIDGKPMRLPTEPWNRRGRYTIGQVWRPRHVDANDLNPRPLNPRTPSNGLIGCYSADERRILATAWEPYQELFAGVLCCIHSDFRIAGLAPGERKVARGKIYLVDADLPALLDRYRRDFPEHTR